MGFTKEKFFITDAIDPIEGYEKEGEKGWNGWACPLFDRAGVEKIAHSLDLDVASDMQIYFEGNDAFLRDENGVTKLEALDHNGKIIYDCSLGWTWECEKRIQIVQDIEKFIFAGNCTFTMFNSRTGKHLTYKVQKLKPHKKKPGTTDDVWFISALTGSNNEDDFAFIGSIRFPNAVCSYNHSAKAKLPKDDLRSISFAWFAQNINALPDSIRVFHEGTCAKCGRKLTVPESVKSGYGPSCYRSIFGKNLIAKKGGKNAKNK